MELAGFVHTENRSLQTRIFEKLEAAAFRRYGLRINRPAETKHGFLFASTGATVLTEGTLGVAVTGYTTSGNGRVLRIVKEQMREQPFLRSDPVRIGESLGGTHGITAVNEFGSLIWCSLPGCSPPYYCDIEGIRVACSRPGLLKAAFNLGPDESYFQQVVTIGYPLDESSPYEGASCVIGGTALRSSGGRSQIVPYILPEHGFIPKGEAEAIEAEAGFRREIIRATEAVGQFKRVEFRLSGGKDSRLVASALHQTGGGPVAHTAGGTQRAIGRAVAKEVGLRFMTSEGIQPVGGNADLIDQCLRALRTTDAFVPLQGDNCLTSREPVFREQDGLLAGQIQLHKGGYAKGLTKLGRGAAIKKLEKGVIPVTVADKRPLSRKLAERFDYKQYADPMDILYFPYAGTRASRYLEVSYWRYSYKFMPVFPPNDERVYMAVSNLDRTRRSTEISLYKVTEANSPKIVQIPIHDGCYVFQGDQPDIAVPVDEEAKKRGPKGLPKPGGPDSKNAVSFCKEVVASSSLRDMIKESVIPEMHPFLGLGPGAARLRLSRVSRLPWRAHPLRMRVFMLAVALDNWDAI